MRFLADMGVDIRVVNWLRQRGHDAKHLRDEGLHRIPNGEIVALSGRQKSSVILFRLHNTRTPHVIDRLTAVLSSATKALQEGAVIVVEESRHRVRYLPLGKTKDSRFE